MCSINFVTKHGVESALNVLNPKEKTFYQFKFLVHFNLQKSPPNLINHKIAPTAHEITTEIYFSAWVVSMTQHKNHRNVPRMFAFFKHAGAFYS